MTKSAKKQEAEEAAERLWLLYRTCSCVDCGVLVRFSAWPGRSVELYDLQPDLIPRLADVFGMQAVMGQGIGVAYGSRHRCPPCWKIKVESATAAAIDTGPPVDRPAVQSVLFGEQEAAIGG